jgi:hypothetical protein
MIARGAYRLPPLPTLFTGLVFGAGVGALSGLVFGGVAQGRFGGFAVAGFVLGLMAGPIVGLISAAIALTAAWIYTRFSGRSRRELITTAALAAATSTVALLVGMFASVSASVPAWWYIVNGAIVFALTAFQAQLLITASPSRTSHTTKVAIYRCS